MSNINDFNKSPYFDDFDKNKNYLRVLFKPGLPVQGRELNQIQSILQNQIGEFADHVFKNGSKVSNCRASIVYRNYARLLDVYADTMDAVDVEQFDETYRAVGESSKVEGRFIKGTNKTIDDPATMFVIYDTIGTFNDVEQKEFMPGEVVAILDKNNVAVKRVIVRCPGCPESGLPNETPATGTAAFYAVDDGVLYFNQYFVQVQRQEIILIKYVSFDESGNVTNKEKFKVGMDFVEQIVTATDDPTLYDPSLGYPNYAAPGADRYHGEFILVKRAYEAEDGDTFVLFAKLLEGLQPEYVKADSEYGQLNEEFARRTYETSGNFTVNPYKTKFYEAKKTANNGAQGWSDTGKEKDLVAVLSPGISYVKGNRNETKADSVVTFEKARDTEKVDNFTQYFPNRPYIKVKPISISHIVSPNNTPTIVSTKELQLYSGPITNGSVSGNNIGFVKVIDQSKEGDHYKLYVYDVTITAQNANIGQVRSVKTADNVFIGEAVLTDGRLEISDANNISLLYKINKDLIRSLRDVDNNENGDTTMFLRRKLIGRTDNNGRVTFNAQTNESFLVFNPQENFAYVGTANAPSAMITLTNANYVSSGGTLTVDVGSANANTEIVVYSNIQKVNQTENTKVLTLKTFTVTDTGGNNSIIKLGVADAFLIKSIMYDSGNGLEDIKSEFLLQDGQTDMYYTESQIKRIVNRTMPANASIIVSVYYFKHEGNAGFFSVDSYSQLLDEENEWGLTYKDIPSYTTTNGVTVRLSDAFDFRPIYMNNVIEVGTSIPVQSTTAIFDVEFYLPRTDLLCVNSKNEFYVKKGTPSLNPVTPVVDQDSMSLYEIRLAAYTFDIKGVSTKFIENKRYTMRDIGRLEKRISNVEYYVQLNALEQSTVNMSVKDKDGFDRYKNGMLVDGFADFNGGGDILNSEFRCTYDTSRGEMRPIGVANSTKLEVDYDKSVNVERKGNMLMIPYNEERFQENAFATRSISINPYMTYNKRGNLVLSPNIDTWSDTDRLPDVVVDIDSGTEAIKNIAEASGLLGTKYGSWSAMNTTMQMTDNLQTTGELTGERKWMKFGNNGMHWGLGQILTTTNQQTGTITSTQTRTATTTTLESRTNEYKITDIVKDVSIQPYVRSRIVEFYGAKMKPNRTIYAFFDGQDVTKYCRMKEAVIYDAMEIEKMRRSTIFGGNPLKTDANGEIRGEFRIPENTFFTGQKTFVLTDDPKNTGSDDRTTTSASAVYFAGGINQSKQDSTLNVITPQWNSSTRTEEKTINQTITSRDQTTTEVIKDVSTGQVIESSTTVVNEAPPKVVVNQWKSWWNVDPVAQAFVVNEPCFITRIQLYFKEVDETSDTIWVELRTMQNGYPTTTVLGRKDYSPKDIKPFVSENSLVPFNVRFDVPVFVDANISYCFVIGGYSPNTRLWLSHLGEEVVNIPGKIVEEPPTPFASFRSINGETWNAEQYENIKHGLYRAVFKSRDMTVKVKNVVEQAPIKLEKNPIEIQANVNRVRVYAKNHGVSVTDRVSLSLFDGIEIDVEVANTTPPQISQKITTPTGSGIVTDIKLGELANRYTMTLKNVQGTFIVGQSYDGEIGSRPFRDVELMKSNGNFIPQEILINESFGKIMSDPTDAIGYNNIGGATFDKFNYEHVVVEVDSADTFIIEIAHNFNRNGRFGGEFGSAFDISRRYEMYNISGAYSPYGAIEQFTMTPIKYTPEGMNNIDKPLEFYINRDFYVPYSMKMLSNKNEVRVFGTNRRSIDANLTFRSQSTYLSPVINADSFSIVTVSNRVDEHKESKMNVLPNNLTQFVPETETTGNGIFKYVTQKVLMKDAAQELKIFVDVYKDVTADFDIYVKPMEAHETRNEDALKWVKVDKINKTLSSNGVSDYLEYEISCSEDCSLWKTNLEFIGYRVKIVGTATNAAKPPMFKNLRTIAVT